MKYLYNQSVSPPAPFVKLIVADPTDSTRQITVDAQIDSAADISTLPNSIVEQLELPVSGSLEIAGYDGNPSIVTLRDAVLILDKFKFSGARIVPTNADYALLGRDVINFLRLVLDGPALTLEILD